VPSPTTFPAERIVRLVFGVVVVPFFGGLAVMLAVARSSIGNASRANAPPDVLLVVGILLLGSIAGYGLDQLLTGIRPSRRRWFSAAERTVEITVRESRGRGSVTVAHLWGAPVRVHWSFLAGLFLVGGFRPGAWAGFIAVIVSHELGHAILVRRFGQQVVGFSFHALGGECGWIGRPSHGRRALIAWGGVAGQTMVLCVALVAIWLWPGVFAGWFGTPLEHALVHANLVMAAFNLLPISPLDGAEAWRLVSSRARRAGASPARDTVLNVVNSALERARRKSD
jgi:stage IV sporulation protein FB